MTRAENRPHRPRFFLLRGFFFALLVATSAVAHPMGFGTADVRLSEDRYSVELVLDAPPEAAQVRTAQEKQAYEELLAKQLRESFAMKFDGVVSSSSVKILAVGTGAAAIDVLRVTGAVPLEARRLVIGVGPEVGDLGVEVRADALLGTLRGLVPKGEESPPIDLTGTGDNSEWAVSSNTVAADRGEAAAAPVPSSSSQGSNAPVGRVPEQGTRGTRRPVELGFGAMVQLGFGHIVPDGLDHVLFIIGLLLLHSRESGRWRWLRRLGLQLTLFTLAHSVTLALGAFGFVNTPPSVIEPLIALSIVYVGVEPLLARRDSPTGTSRCLRGRRMVVVLAFGLLHGLGFASALAARGLSEGLLLRSLLAFNIGVEAGQFLVALAFAALVFQFRESERYFKIVVLPCSLGISLIALVWFFERI